MASSEIHGVRTTSGQSPQYRRIIEELTQSFLPGTPVQIAAGDGGVQAWDGVTIARGIAGFSGEPASSLTATGVAKFVTFGSVPNESAAVNIPRGAPFNDGRVGFEVANEDTEFKGQVGPAQTALATDIGVQYGMTKDTDNHWFVDKTKLTVGTNTVVVITKLDPADQSASPRGVYFKVIKAAQQLAQ